MPSVPVFEVYVLFCVCEKCRSLGPVAARYVGISTKGHKNRLRAHFAEARSGSDFARGRWIRKHGEPNIQSAVVETLGSMRDLLDAEVKWIATLGTYASRSGLNMTRGGEGVLGLVHREDTRELFRVRTAKQMAEKHPRSKLTRFDVETIIERIWSGETCPEIAHDYPVSAATIQKIRSGDNWPEVPRPKSALPPRGEYRPRRRVDRQTAESVRSDYTGEWGELKRLAEKYDLCEATVSLIVNRRGRYNW